MKKNIDIGPAGHSPCVEPVPPVRISPDDLSPEDEATRNKPSVEELPHQETDNDNPSASNEKVPPTQQDKSDNHTPPAQL